MKHRFLLLFTLLIFLSSHSVAIGQEETEEASYTVENQSDQYSDFPPRAKFATIGYFAMLPVQTFDEIVMKNLHGFSMSYLVERKNTNYNFWGFELTYNHIGSDRNTFIGTGYNGPFDIEEITGSNLWSVHFLYRVYPDFFFWRIEPYMEVALGTNMFFTTTTTNYFDEPSSTEFDFNEFNMGLSYGLNLGFTTQIAGQVFLNTKFGYYSGNNTSYMVPSNNGSSIPIENFNSETSQTNAVHIKVGITYSFY